MGINVNNGERIEGWQDGATVAWITVEITRRDGTIEWWARECAREEEATGHLYMISQFPDWRLVSAELMPRVTPRDLMAAIAPSNREVALAGWSNNAERCTCADEVLYTVTAKSPDGTVVTTGPMSKTWIRDPDPIAGIVRILREERPGAEITVEAGPNPDYRPDCSCFIPEDAAYVRYVGASRGSADERYCQRCALAIWGNGCPRLRGVVEVAIPARAKMPIARLVVRLESDEPLARMYIMIVPNQGIAFSRNVLGVVPVRPGEVALAAFTYDRDSGEPAGIQPQDSVIWAVDFWNVRDQVVWIEALCRGPGGELWESIPIEARVKWLRP
jgi:hypothetical protein